MRSRKLISLILTTTLITFMKACSETTSNTSEVATVVPTKPVPVAMELPTMIPGIGGYQYEVTLRRVQYFIFSE